MSTNTVTRPATLSDDVLETFRQRAPEHDRKRPVPCRPGRPASRRLAARRGARRARRARPGPRAARPRAAPHGPLRAVDRAVDVHAPLLGRPRRRPAAVRRAFADRILGWVDAGEILASGHGEVGTTSPSPSRRPAPSGCRAAGASTAARRSGSLGPVWDRLGFHAMDASDPAAPSWCTASCGASTTGVTVVETWDAQGMRATESHDTVLDGVFVADADVLCVVPAGPTDHPAVGVLSMWALTLIANVLPRHRRAGPRDRRRRRVDALRRSPSRAPHVRPHARAAPGRVDVLTLDPARATVERLAQDGRRRRPRATAWGLQILSAKWQAHGGDRGRRPRARGLRRRIVRRGTEIGAPVARRPRRSVPPAPSLHPRGHRQGPLGIDPSGPRW
jgi:hypothetical protein